MTDSLLPVDMNGAPLSVGDTFVFVFNNSWASSYGIRRITSPVTMGLNVEIPGFRHEEVIKGFGLLVRRDVFDNSFELFAESTMLVPKNIMALGLPNIKAFIKLSGVEVGEYAE